MSQGRNLTGTRERTRHRRFLEQRLVPTKKGQGDECRTYRQITVMVLEWRACMYNLEGSPWIENRAVDFDQKIIGVTMIHIQIADCHTSCVQTLQAVDRRVHRECNITE